MISMVIIMILLPAFDVEDHHFDHRCDKKKRAEKLPTSASLRSLGGATAMINLIMVTFAMVTFIVVIIILVVTFMCSCQKLLPLQQTDDDVLNKSFFSQIY